METPAKERRWRRWLLLLALVLVAILVAAWVTYGGGAHEGPGRATAAPLPSEALSARAERQEGVGAAGAPQILFGDLHVHTTFSADAFFLSLPLLSGEGAHPPADACDFARFCSDLDFFAITDHAESLTPGHWAETRAAIRQCNAVSGGADDPDLVAFTGFEWSQVGITPETHYGHKNVIFQQTDDAHLPARAIGAPGPASQAMKSAVDPWLVPLVPVLDFSRRQRYLDLAVYLREVAAMDECPAGVDTRELPPDCRETAGTPRELFEKLGQWGFDALVIPHGTTWGFYTPPGYTWDKQISPSQDDPERQRLVEVYSGHGNSEEYRPWRAVELDGEGELACPAPSDGYEPCCHRAGEIIRARCEDPGSARCEERVRSARIRYLRAGVAGHLTLPWATLSDWGGCGQCTDCFNPAFNSRPGGSVQYMLARGDFEDPERPRHQTLGFIASSDNHTARPGTGYKELERRRMTEATGPEDEAWRDRIWGEPPPPGDEALSLEADWLLSQPPFRLVHVERQASFFMTGGLVAVHAEGRSRGAIWEALRERRVYGTSGDRILLWFDLLNAPGGARGMGSELAMGDAPRFRVRAAGAFRQAPGCPSWSEGALGPDELERICAGECYHPTDERRRITRIELVRIRRQRAPEEPIASLIDDPWRVLPCPDDRAVCEVELDDAAFPGEGRDAAYYARAIQEPTLAVNAGTLRCDGDECAPCYGDWRTAYDDDCLSDNEERAWSSPIYLRFDHELSTPPEESAPASADTRSEVAP